MIYWLKTGKDIEDIETFRTMYLPLEADALDDSGNGHNGTATAIIYSDIPDVRLYLPLTADDDDDSDFAVTTTPTDITYGADGAIFNGTSSKIVTNLSIPDLTGWSIDFEFKRDGTPAAIERIISSYVDASNYLYLGFSNTSGKLIIVNRVAGSSATTLASNNNLCDNSTHRVNVKFISTTTLQITVDNVAEPVQTLSVALSSFTAPIINIGTLSGSSFYTGTLKNLRFFNRNLTTAEITQLYTYNTFTALDKNVAVFNGSTSDVACGNVINNLTGCAVSFWFKRNYVPAAYENLFVLYESANDRVLCRIETGGRVYLLNVVGGVSSTILYHGASSLCDGALHHIIINFIDSTHIQFIVDGVAGSSQVLTVALDTLTTPTLTLGAQTSASTTNVLNGCIGDFYLFDRNLTEVEYTALYNDNFIDPYLYDTDCYPLDTGAIQINLDTPKRKYNKKNIIGNGSSISGGDYYSDRTISFSRIFKKDGVSTSGALTVARNDFINRFITLSDDLYFVRDYNGLLQYIQVFPMMGNEKYKNLLVSEDFEVSLLCNIPFFTDSLSTLSDSFSKTSRYFDYDMNVVGLPVPIIFEGTFTSNDVSITLGVFENYGANIAYPFLAGDVIRFDSGSMRLWVNDVERFNATITGTPFVLLSGDTTLRIECISAMTLCTVSYVGRYL